MLNLLYRQYNRSLFDYLKKILKEQFIYLSETTRRETYEIMYYLLFS